jgi:hypothetical protein
MPYQYISPMAHLFKILLRCVNISAACPPKEHWIFRQWSCNACLPGAPGLFLVVAAGDHVGERGAGDVREVGDAGVLSRAQDLLRLRHYVAATSRGVNRLCYFLGKKKLSYWGLSALPNEAFVH